MDSLPAISQLASALGMIDASDERGEDLEKMVSTPLIIGLSVIFEGVRSGLRELGDRKEGGSVASSCGRSEVSPDGARHDD